MVSLFMISSSLYAESNKNHAQSAEMFSGGDTQAAKVVQSFHTALQSGNQKLARSLLSDDVLIYEGGGVERSAEEYANHHMLADIEYLAGLEVKVLEHQVKVYGDIALSYSRSYFKGNYKGEKIERNGMETINLRKINGEWKITHIHWS